MKLSKSILVYFYFFISFSIAFLMNSLINVSQLKAIPQASITPSKPNSIIQKIAVLGKDNRIPLPNEYQSLAAGIGIIGQPGKKGWRCTAFCVAPNIIATNAHCILRNPTMGKRLNLAKTIFMLPPLSKTTFNQKFKARISYPEYVHGKMPGLSIYGGNYRNSKSLSSQKQDWAFTKLIHSVCKGRTLTFKNVELKKIKKAAKKNNVFMIGFHGDKEMKSRLYSNKCQIRSRSNKTFFLRKQRIQLTKEAVLLPHTCDAFKGSSGSPILLKTNSGLKVVGINLGSLRYEHFRIKRNRYTKKIISRRRLKSGRETNIAIQPKIFLAGLKRFEKETLLNDINEFKIFQSHLKELRLYRGKIDGKFGRRTKRAITAFEKEMKLPHIGIPTKELLELLTKKVQAKKSSKQ